VNAVATAIAEAYALGHRTALDAVTDRADLGMIEALKGAVGLRGTATR
jgi:hypothetical protein